MKVKLSRRGKCLLFRKSNTHEEKFDPNICQNFFKKDGRHTIWPWGFERGHLKKLCYDHRPLVPTDSYNVDANRSSHPYANVLIQPVATSSLPCSCRSAPLSADPIFHEAH